MQAFDHLVPMDLVKGSSDAAQPNQMPSWLVKILDYTESAVEGFEGYSALRGYYSRISRGTNMTAQADVLSSNTLRHSPVILYIPRGNLETKLESHIYKANPINKITIVNIAEINGTIEKLQEIEYEQCYVQQLEPVLDWLLVELKITKYNNTLFKYGTEGRLLGKDMATMDCTLHPKADVHVYNNKPSEDEGDLPEKEDQQEDSHEDLQENGSDAPDNESESQQEGTLSKGKHALSKVESLIDGGEAAVLDKIEGRLPPAGKKALGAVKALAGSDKKAVAQSVMGLLGVDQKHVDQAKKAKKFLGSLKKWR